MEGDGRREEGLKCAIGENLCMGEMLIACRKVIPCREEQCASIGSCGRVTYLSS